MSFLQSEVPSPRQMIAALRRRGEGTSRSARPGTPRRSLRGSARAVVGLDIEPGYVSAVETSPHSVAVRRAAFMELPPDVVKDGEVVDPEALGTLLRDFFAEHELGTRVRVGLANQRIVMRTIDLPPITDEKALASAIRFQAQEHIAMPLDQAVLEHQSLGLVGTAEGPRSRVVLVAARRDMVERLLDALRIAGLTPEGIDLAAFALIRALRAPEDGDDPIAYINLGSVTNIAVASETDCLFTRVIPYGIDAVSSELSGRRGLTAEHSRGWLRHVGLGVPVDQLTGEPDIVRATREVLEEGVARIAAEVRATLDFYSAQTGGRPTQIAVATGPGAAIPGLVDQLAEDLRIPVSVRIVPEGQVGAYGGIDATYLSVAAGLTTSEAPR